MCFRTYVPPLRAAHTVIEEVLPKTSTCIGSDLYCRGASLQNAETGDEPGRNSAEIELLFPVPVDPGKLKEPFDVRSGLFLKPIKDLSRIIPEICISELIQVGFKNRVRRVVHPRLPRKVAN